MAGFARFEGRVAMVTGAGRGIGAACARDFAREGAKVILVSRTKKEIDSVAASIRKSGHEALAQVADVADEGAVLKAFDKAKREFGAIDILVNNAAVPSIHPVTELTLAEWERTLGINLRGPFLCSREAFRQMKAAKKGGAIVNIASLAGIRGVEKFPGMCAYTSSKHGVVGLTEALAVEGRKLGIRVNCVAPGAVDTQMLREAAPFLKTKTSPEQVARTILFFADDRESGAISGSVLEIFSNA